MVVDLTPLLEGMKWYERRLTVALLRAALVDLPDDATVESGWYGCWGVTWDAAKNVVNIDNDE